MPTLLWIPVIGSIVYAFNWMVVYFLLYNWDPVRKAETLSDYLTRMPGIAFPRFIWASILFSVFALTLSLVFRAFLTVVWPIEDKRQRYGTGGGGGKAGPKAVFDQKKFDNCVKKLFNAVVTSESLVEGSPGKSDDSIWHGATIAGVAVALQTSLEKDSATLGKELLADKIGDGSPNSGATYGGSPGHNYIASDIYANLSPVFPGGTAAYTAIGFKALKIHELGNALAGLRKQLAQGRNNPEYGIRDSIKNIGDYGEENKKYGIGDPDAGAALENCVFGGIVNVRNGQVGKGRVFQINADQNYV